MHYFIYPFCSIFIIVGAAILFDAVRGMVQARAIENWPTVDAQLSHCELKHHHDSEGNSSEVIVRYEYSVRGTQYTNNKIHPTYSASSFDCHRPLYEKLKNSTIVRARYNELKPQESYIVTGRYSSSLAGLFGGLLFMTMGLIFMLIFHFAMMGNSNYAAGLHIVR